MTAPSRAPPFPLVPPPAPSRRSSVATATRSATSARVSSRPWTPSSMSSAPSSWASRPATSASSTARCSPRRQRQQGQARRQRHPRCLARRGPCRRRQSAGPAAVPLRRRPERPRPARADDEHPQRWRARRHQCRHPGVHDRPDRRRILPRGPALGRRGLPRAQVGAQEAGPGHRARRRGWLRAQPALQPRRPRPDPRGRSSRAGYEPGSDIALALDVAASEFYNEDGSYTSRGARSQPPR
jgi:hypothetical protein